MASLISPDLMAQLMIRRQMPLTVGTGLGQAAPPAQPVSMPAMSGGELTRAHNIARGQTAAGSPTPQYGQPGTKGPMTSDIFKNKLLEAYGIDSADWDQYKGLSPQETEYLLKLKKANAKGKPEQHNFSGAEQQQQPAGQNMPLGNRGIGGMFGGRAALKPGGIAMQGPAGLTSAMAPAPQQRQSPDAVVQAINQFKGHVGDDVLAQAQAAVNAGVPVQQVIDHLQRSVQQRAAARGQTAKEATQSRHTEFQENARRLDEARHRLDEITSKDAMLKSGNADLMQRSPNFAEYQQLQGVVRNLGNQLINGGQGGTASTQQHQAAPQTHGTFTFSGQTFQVGRAFKGPDGKQYMPTGKTHADGTPEIVPASQS